VLNAILISVAAYFLISFIQSTMQKGKDRRVLEREKRAAKAATPTTEGKLDPHEVLGVSRRASPEEIQAAYKKLAADYHPDKIAGSAKELRELAERRLREINVAYDALTKRR
jgi:DnaJ-class molecular chaperone